MTNSQQRVRTCERGEAEVGHEASHDDHAQQADGCGRSACGVSDNARR